jgi:hypothetical protein
MLVILVLLVVVLALQYTRYALLVTRNNTALWITVGSALTGMVILRSGWGSGDDWEAGQRALGTLSNSYYQPRRRALTDGGAILGGVLGATWWGASSLILLFAGMRRHVAARGLFDFEVSVLVGALAGGVVGAVIGTAAGNLWERRHRRQRRPGAAQ